VTTSISLPAEDGQITSLELREPGPWHQPRHPAASRMCYAAAHVVADAAVGHVPGEPPRLDWDSTLAARRYLWSWGLGVADAMDTAQRGMGLDWDTAQELIRRSAAEAASVGGQLVAGAATDQLPPVARDLAEIAAAYQEQVAFIHGTGAQAVLMASRQLARLAGGPDDYLRVYDQVLSQLSEPVLLHWLGEAFDPALAGYWGSADLGAAASTLVALVCEHAAVIEGVKISLLDADLEVRLREQLPTRVRVYTGDDLNYPELIRGDGKRHSHALLGVFAAIAPAAATALERLDEGDDDGFTRILEPTQALSRHLFSQPTQYYKTGIAFLSWLNGHQSSFTMIGGLQNARGLPYMVRTFILADEAGLLLDPSLAVDRMTAYLRVNGASL
jgi:Protein of unknown function (DUF993)